MTDTGEDRLIKFYEEQQQKEDEQTTFDRKDQFEFIPAIYNLPVVQNPKDPIDTILEKRKEEHMKECMENTTLKAFENVKYPE